MKISKYLTLQEAINSPTAKRLQIDNTPTPEHLVNMKYIASEIFDKVREHVGGALHVSSFYRSPRLNKAVNGSSPTSQHQTGQAMDIDTKRYGNGTNKQVFDYIKDNLNFDQLIWEFGTDKEPDWVHVSLKKSGNRKRVLKAIKQNGVIKYVNV
jgi:zinc D-Ala-D-Ala carboxypeptidase